MIARLPFHALAFTGGLLWRVIAANAHPQDTLEVAWNKLGPIWILKGWDQVHSNTGGPGIELAGKTCDGAAVLCESCRRAKDIGWDIKVPYLKVRGRHDMVQPS